MLERAGKDAMAAAEWCEHAAALLAGGIPSARLPGLLPPLSASDALAGQLDRAMRVAAEAGCPIGPTLQQLAVAARSEHAAMVERENALAAPRATARLLLLLPIAMIPLGAGLGADPVGVLSSSALGWLSILLSLVLLGGAWRCSVWLEARARAAVPPPGIALDVLAALVAAGLAPERARARWGSLGQAESQAFEAALARASQAGCAVSGSLRAAATTQRLAASATAGQAARRLAVWLSLPLGFGALPAFVLLGVVPLAISLAGHSLFR